MKLIELFENTILNEVGETQGWWISPAGEVFKVDGEGHVKFIINNIEEFTPPHVNKLEFHELYDRAFFLNWVRLGSYAYGKNRRITVEGRSGSLREVYDLILDIAAEYNLAEVNKLSEISGKTSSGKIHFGSDDFQLFDLPEEEKELEKYLRS